MSAETKCCSQLGDSLNPINRSLVVSVAGLAARLLVCARVKETEQFNVIHSYFLYEIVNFFPP